MEPERESLAHAQSAFPCEALYRPVLRRSGLHGARECHRNAGRLAMGREFLFADDPCISEGMNLCGHDRLAVKTRRSIRVEE